MVTIKNLPGTDVSSLNPVFEAEKDNILSIASTIEKMKKAGYDASEYADMQETVDLYLEKLNKAIGGEKKSPAGRKITTKKTRKRGGGPSKPVKHEKPKPTVPTASHKPAGEKTTIKTVKKKTPIPAILEMDAARVRKLSPEIFFLKRFLAFHKREKTRTAVLRLLHDFQDAVATGEIKKGNPWKAELEEMQDKLVAAHGKMKKNEKTEFAFTDEMLGRYTAAVGSEKVYPSILMIRRFIQMQGKSYKPVFIANMAKNIAGLLANKNVQGEDPFVSELKQIGAYLNKIDTGGSMNIIIKPGPTPLSGPGGLARLAGLCSVKPQSARCKAIFARLHERGEYDKTLNQKTKSVKKR